MAAWTENTKAPGRVSRAVRAAWTIRLLSKTRTALVLMGALLLYLAAASLWPPPPGTLPGTPGAMYGWVGLKILVGLLVLSLLCATVTRVPLRWTNMGVWLAHGGAIALVGGASWYAAGKASGLAGAFRERDGQFTPVERFYLSDTAAIYVSAARTDVGTHVQTPVARLLALEAGEMINLPVRCPFGDVSISAWEYLPAAELDYEWRDDGPAEVLAARIVVADGARQYRGVLCPQYHFARELKPGAYVIRLAPADGGESPDWLLSRDRQGQDVVIIRRPIEGKAAVEVFSENGTSIQYEANVGEQIPLKLARGDVLLTVERFFTRAWRAWRAYPARGAAAPAAVRLKLTVGQWTGWQWLGFQPFLPPGAQGDPTGGMFPDEIVQRLHLSDGRTLWLGFAPRSRPMPTPVRIARYERLTYPGSDKARDYICWLDPAGPDDAQPQLLECRMNHPVSVGDLRVYPHEWDGGPAAPRQITFMISRRPGMWAIWAGAVLICLGLPYDFYVKPLLLRRRKGATP